MPLMRLPLLACVLVVYAAALLAGAASVPLSCSNRVLDGNETDVDCGGGTCASCALNKFCDSDADCLTGMCETDDRFICVQDCHDKPCGSFACPRCDVGRPCEHNDQCRSDLCDDGVCTHRSCPRCGDLHCPKCPAGSSCSSSAQCASRLCSTLSLKCLPASCPGKCGGLCDPCALHAGPCESDTDCQSSLACSPASSTCLAAHCFNARLDSPSESDVDCGGSLCLPCPALAKCRTTQDCAPKHVCDADAQQCVAVTCIDGVRNHGESGVDCGNSAVSGCLPCQALGSACESNADVDVKSALSCDPHYKVVVPETCFDGKTSQGETGVDCGGPCANKCASGQGCVHDKDCAALDCYNGECLAASCNDGVQSPLETGVDCGGKCRPCKLGQACRGDSDCQSGMCSEFTGKCQPNECATHCGGPCDACPDSSMCSADTDCTSGFCYGDAPVQPGALFGAGQQMGAFLYPEAARGVCLAARCRRECGVGDCPGCRAGLPCSRDAECASGRCDAADKLICLADTCFDGLFNGAESDVDCGGPLCARCKQGLACTGNGDCASSLCGANHVCLPRTCVDGALSPLETDVDCGGVECLACALGKKCVLATDCASGACNAGTCVTRACMNQALDAGETDVDCGGAHCLGCDVGRHCDGDADCASDVCRNAACLPARCKLVCGAGCTLCLPGQPCVSSNDCDQARQCDNGRCVAAAPECARAVALMGATDFSGCGGPKCPTCGAHRACRTGSDCAAGLQCAEAKCLPVHCLDGRLSGEEGCVDGGGACARRCAEDEACTCDGDCASGLTCGGGNVCMRPAAPPLPASEAAAAAIETEDEGGLVDCAGVFVRDAECALGEPAAAAAAAAAAVTCRLVTADSVCDPRWNCLEHGFDGGACARVALPVDVPPASTPWAARLRDFVAGFTAHSLKGVLAGVSGGALAHDAYRNAALPDLAALESQCRNAWDCSTQHALSPSVRVFVRHARTVDTAGAAQALVVRGALDVAALVESLAETVVQSGGLVVVRRGGVLRAHGGLFVLAGGRLVVEQGGVVAGRVLVVAGAAVVRGQVDFALPTAVLGSLELASDGTAAMVVLPGGALALTSSEHAHQVDMRFGSVRVGDGAALSGRWATHGGVVALGAQVALANAWESAGTLVLGSGNVELRAGANVTWRGAPPDAPRLPAEADAAHRVSRALTASPRVLETAVHAHVVVRPGAALTIEGNATLRSLVLAGTLTVRNGELTVADGLDATSADSHVILASSATLAVHRASQRLVFAGRVSTQGAGARVLAVGASQVVFTGAVVWTLSDFSTLLPATWIVFDGSFTATSTLLTVSQSTRVELNGPGLIVGRMVNYGALTVGATGRTVVANALSGPGALRVDGTLAVLGEAVVTGSLTGAGTIQIDVRDASLLASLSAKLFAPATLLSTCQTRVRVALSPTLFASFILQRCGSSVDDVVTALKSMLGASNIVLTGNYGAVVRDTLPAVVQAHVGAQLKADRLLGHDQTPGLVLEAASGGGGSLEARGAAVDFDGHVVVGRKGYVAITAGTRARFKRDVASLGEIWVGQKSRVDFVGHVNSLANFTVDHRANVTFYSKAHFSGHLTNNGGRMTLAHGANMTVDGAFYLHGDFLTLSSSTLSLHSERNTFASTSLLDARGSVYVGHHADVVVFAGALFETSGELVVERGGAVDLRTSDAFFDGGLEVAGTLYVRGASKARARCTGFLRVLGDVKVEAAGSLLVDNKAVVYGAMDVAGALLSSSRGMIEVRGKLTCSGNAVVLDMTVAEGGKSAFSGTTEFKGTVVVAGGLELGGATTVAGSLTATATSEVVNTGSLRITGTMAVHGQFVQLGTVDGDIAAWNERRALDGNASTTNNKSAGFDLARMECDKPGDMLVTADARAVWSGRGSCARGLAVEGELMVDAGASLTLEAGLRVSGKITLGSGATLRLNGDSLLDCSVTGGMGSSLVVAAHVRLSKTATMQRLSTVSIVKQGGVLVLVGKLAMDGAVADVQGELRVEGDALGDFYNSARLEVKGGVQLDGQLAVRGKALASLLGRAGGQGRLVVYDSGRADIERLSGGQVVVHRGGSVAVWGEAQMAVQSQGSFVFGRGASVIVSGAMATLAGDTMVDGNVTVRASLLFSGKLSVEGRLELAKSASAQAGELVVSGSVVAQDALALDVDSSAAVSGSLVVLGLSRLDTGARLEVGGSVRLEDVDASGNVRVLRGGTLELAGRAVVSGALDVQGALLVENDFCQGGAATEIMGALAMAAESRLLVGECAKVVWTGALSSTLADVRIDGVAVLGGTAVKHIVVGGDALVSGTVVVLPGALVDWASPTRGAGTWRVGGILQLVHVAVAAKLLVVEASGTLAGSGALRQCVVEVVGRLEPGSEADVGSLMFDASPVNITGVLEVDFANGRHDVVDAYGGAPLRLAGVLAVVLAEAAAAATAVDFTPVTADVLEWTGSVVASARGGASLHAKTRLTTADADMRTGLAVTVERAKGRAAVGAACTFHVVAGAFASRADCERLLGGACVLTKDGGAQVDLGSDAECAMFCDVVRAAALPAGARVEPACDDASASAQSAVVRCVTDGRGTAPLHEPCALPFVFDGQVHFACASDDALGLWCLTGDGRWGGCTCGPFAVAAVSQCRTNGIGAAREGELCASACVGHGLGGFGACVTAQGLVGGCSETCAAMSHTRGVGGCVTNGQGEAPAGEPCALPFTWGGKTRHRCVGAGLGGQGFCLTAKRQRGGCACPPLLREPAALDAAMKSQAAVDEAELFMVQGPFAKAHGAECARVWGSVSRAGALQVDVVNADAHDALVRRIAVQATPAFELDVCGLARGGAFTAVFVGLDADVALPLAVQHALVVEPAAALRLVEGGAAGTLWLSLPGAAAESERVRAVLPATGGLAVEPGDVRVGASRVALAVRAIADGVHEAEEHVAVLAFASWGGGDILGTVAVRIADRPRAVAAATDARAASDGAALVISQPRGRAAVMRMGGEPVEYTLALASQPSALVSVAVKPAGDAAAGVQAEPAVVVFTHDDWSRARTLRLYLSSEAWLSGDDDVAVRVVHAARSADGRFDGARAVLDTKAGARAAAAGVLVHPSVVVAHGGRGELFVSLPPWRAGRGGVKTVALRGDGLAFDPDRLEFGAGDDDARTTKRVAVRVLQAGLPGQQRAATVVDGEDGGNVSVPVNATAPVVAVSALSVQVPGWFTASLSAQPASAVALSWALDPGDVCLDVDRNWESPCSALCAVCANDAGVLALQPAQAEWTPAAWQAAVNVSVVRVQGRYAQDVFPASTRLLSVVQSVDPAFNDLAMAFGPGLVPVPGVLVVYDAVDIGAVLLAQRTRGSSVAVSLAYLPRADVTVAAGACTPASLFFPALAQTSLVTQCAGAALLLASSTDPTFDGVTVQVGAPGPASADDGLVTRIIVGATTSLATLVAVLAVWIYIGPRAFSTRAAARRKRGKRKSAAARLSVADASTMPGQPPSPPTHARNSRAMAALFLAPAPLQLHVGQAVVVFYDFDASYHAGSILVAHGDGTFHVAFDDGDEDEVVDGDDVRVLNASSGAVEQPRKVNRDGLIDAKVSASADGGFGLVLGATSNGRVVITGFAPNGPAVRVLELALGDEVVQIGVSRVDGLGMEDVARLVRASGQVLQLKLRPAAVQDLMLG